jgi:hypothetical protein
MYICTAFLPAKAPASVIKKSMAGSNYSHMLCFVIQIYRRRPPEPPLPEVRPLVLPPWLRDR